jgi:hypothetical protein
LVHFIGSSNGLRVGWGGALTHRQAAAHGDGDTVLEISTLAVAGFCILVE